jgi:hypothetical protein
LTSCKVREAGREAVACSRHFWCNFCQHCQHCQHCQQGVDRDARKFGSRVNLHNIAHWHPGQHQSAAANWSNWNLCKATLPTPLSFLMASTWFNNFNEVRLQ